MSNPTVGSRPENEFHSFVLAVRPPKDGANPTSGEDSRGNDLSPFSGQGDRTNPQTQPRRLLLLLLSAPSIHRRWRHEAPPPDRASLVSPGALLLSFLLRFLLVFFSREIARSGPALLIPWSAAGLIWWFLGPTPAYFLLVPCESRQFWGFKRLDALIDWPPRLSFSGFGSTGWGNCVLWRWARIARSLFCFIWGGGICYTGKDEIQGVNAISRPLIIYSKP